MPPLMMILCALIGADPFAAARVAIRTEIEAGLFPGAVVMLGTGDDILFHEAQGDAQVRPVSVAMQTDSIFDLASVTKAVATATAIGILVDDGLLEFDQSLAESLPAHRGRGAGRITLRHLGAHVSGLRENPRLMTSGTGDEFFAGVLTQQPSWEPGVKFEYACKNCITLSTIVERVSESHFDVFCQRRIFDPLKMRETCFHRVPASPRVVGTFGELGLDHNEDGQAAGRGIGNAGLFSTAGDLARFCQMMLGRGQRGEVRILSEATWTELVTPRFDNSPHAFLWQTGTNLAHRPLGLTQSAFGHSGWTGQSVWIDPQQGLFLLVLTNRVHPERIETSSAQGKEQVRARARIGAALLQSWTAWKTATGCR
jgi:CubicO group peptidase (beta-lactamase class C family)